MRVYKEITEVHSASRGWYNGSKNDEGVDMVSVEYIDIDENGRVFNAGTEDFSIERYDMIIGKFEYEVKKQNGFGTTGKKKYKTVETLNFRINETDRKNWVKLIKKFFPECKLENTDLSMRSIKKALENRPSKAEDICNQYIRWRIDSKKYPIY